MKAAKPLMSEDATARYIYAFLVTHGATPAGACGVLGNVSQECSFNPYCVEDNGEGVGIIQWSFDRKTTFLAAAKAADVEWQDLDFQLDFMLKEMHSYPKTWRQVTGAIDPYQAAILIEADYEGSGDAADYTIANRAIPARDWYNKLVGIPVPPVPKLPTVSLGALLRKDPVAVKAVQVALNTLIDSHLIVGPRLVIDGVWKATGRTQGAYNHFRVQVMGLSTQAAQGAPGSQSLVALGQHAGFNAVR